MLAGIRKRLARKHLDTKECEDDDKDDLRTFTPPVNYLQISKGKIQLVHQSKSLDADTTNTAENTTTATELQSKKERAILEQRIAELEGALLRLQDKVNNSQCISPSFEKELREQIESMNRVMKSKERKQMQTCRDHKALQTRFARQESLLHAMQQENKALIMRIRQYEHCLDDVMRKVVDAIVAEDNLREEVVMLKSRVRDLEAQNAALSASPAKGRDEGYCTMSSGQPQPSNGHLEDLPEEPEQWLLPAEPCSTEMEDWSMSQEELAVITLDEERERNQQRYQPKRLGEQDWIWNSNDFLNSTLGELDTVSDGITQLLQQKLVYSEDEELTCTEFTNDFYKLVNFRSGSARSLYSYVEGETDDEDDDDDSSASESNNVNNLRQVRKRNTTKRLQLQQQKQLQQPLSPTPSEKGRALVTSCSSSETDDLSHCTTQQESLEHEEKMEDEPLVEQAEDEELETEEERKMVNGHNDTEIDDSTTSHLPVSIEEFIKAELRRPPPLIKSKSIIDEEEPSCILRNNQRREIESSVVRSGSVNCAIAANVSKQANTTKLQERLAQKPANSWRRSNGWKRVKSPTQAQMLIPTATNALAHVSPKKETSKETTPTKQTPPTTPTAKLLPTRIPTCISTTTTTATTQQLHLPKLQQQQQNHQLPIMKKSKIPPPVPVRRSYAS